MAKPKRPAPPAAELAGTVSDQIRAAIHARGLTVYQLAEATGIDRTSIRGFVRGDSGINSKNVDKICKALGLQLVEAGRARDRLVGRRKPGAGPEPPPDTPS